MIHKMLEDIIKRVLEAHKEFSYEDIEEICNDFLSEIPHKIKEATKIKRLTKFIDKEFELMSKEDSTKIDTKNYTLETIPKYLFTAKTKIQSGLITISNLVKSMGQTSLFSWANLQVNKKDKIAIIWKNGCWKTTLLKILIGKEKADDGIVEIAPNIKIWYLSQDLFWNSNKNTLREEMLQIFPEITQKVERFEEIKNNPELWEEANQLNEFILQHDGFKKYRLQLDILKYFWFSDEQMNFNVLLLSWGEQTKVQIAKFLISEVDLLILDEPTNHLDIEGILFLEDFCRNWKKAILSISHDVRFINNTSEKIAEISQKKIFYYHGKYDYYLREKQAKYDRDLKNFYIQQKELEKQNIYIERFRYKASKAASVQSRIKAVEKIVKLEKPENEMTMQSIKLEVWKRLPEIIMEFKNLEVGYDYPIVTLPEELIVSKNDKIWIIWANGTGKTTLLKTILWELKELDGNIKINENILIGSYSQVLEDLDMNAKIIDELSRWYKNH